jgi:hypothetical protein
MTQRREGPWLSPTICETLVAYYNEVDLALPEPSLEPTTDLEVNTPIGAYALCAVAVRMRFYSLLAPTLRSTNFLGTTCSAHLLHRRIYYHQREV